MSRINKVPTGLQSALDSKNFGVNPSELAEIVRPSLELDKYYEATSVFSQSVSFTVTSIGAVGSITVPEGQLWQPTDLAVRYLNLFAAGGRIRSAFRVDLLDVDGGLAAARNFAIQNEAPTILDAVSTGTQHGFSYQFAYPVFFESGTTFAAVVLDLDLSGGVSISGTFNMFLRRFSI